MPKEDTLIIQTKVKELGEKLGFVSKMEERLHERMSYAPIYDVVWYLDLEKHFNLHKISELFKNDPGLFKRVKKLPFARFEIEGSATSSKNQISNFANQSLDLMHQLDLNHGLRS